MEGPQSLGGNAFVLVVERDDLIRRLIGLTLRADGHRVLEARDGSDAVWRAERAPVAIDLLVAGASMAGLDGPGIASRIRALHPRAGVVFISDHATDGLPLWPGAAFLRKPFLPAELARAARQALAAARSEGEPACVA